MLVDEIIARVQHADIEAFEQKLKSEQDTRRVLRLRSNAKAQSVSELMAIMSELPQANADMSSTFDSETKEKISEAKAKGGCFPAPPSTAGEAAVASMHKAGLPQLREGE